MYAYISAQLFLTTSGGWMAVFAYILVGGLFYIVSSALLFFSAAFRTTKRRTKVRINSKFFSELLLFKHLLFCLTTLCAVR
jgi:hypothetical protein